MFLGFIFLSKIAMHIIPTHEPGFLLLLSLLNESRGGPVTEIYEFFPSLFSLRKNYPSSEHLQHVG
jgi:hypothetical protein